VIINDKKKENDCISYNASSPDELALVNGARHLGFVFEKRDADGNIHCREQYDDSDNNGVERVYKLLNVIEFDSNRKRMSVIVQTPEAKILVICKGADSVVEKLLSSNTNLAVT